MKFYHSFVAVFMVIMLGVCSSTAAPVTAKDMIRNLSMGMETCIANCAQCHDILGNVFNHRKCSRDCIQRRGSWTLDCTSPVEIKPYLNLKT